MLNHNTSLQILPTTKELEQIFKLAPNEELELIFRRKSQNSTRLGNNSIIQNLSRRAAQLDICLGKDQKLAVIQITDINEKNIIQAIKTLKDKLKYQRPNPRILPLATKQEYKHETQKEDAIYPELSPQQRAEDLQNVIEQSKEHKLISSGILEEQNEKIGYANSAGCQANAQKNLINLNLTVEDDRRSGWALAFARKWPDLDFNNTIQQAIETANQNVNPVPIEPGEYDVILEPHAVGALMSFLANYGFAPRMVVEGSSYLTDSIGKQIFSEKLNMSENAFHPLLSGIPFDLQGLPRRTVKLVKNGVFNESIADRYYASILNTTPSGNSRCRYDNSGPVPEYLHIHGGKTPIDEMIANTGKGLYVRRFHYTNIHDIKTLTLTGITRDGLFLIEDGKIKKAVQNLRFTESLVKAFNQIEAIGVVEIVTQALFGGLSVCPALKIKNFRFTSATGF
jgi:PmbA protein